ncbi:unnamed protein product [Prunus armeniaca]
MIEELEAIEMAHGALLKLVAHTRCLEEEAGELLHLGSSLAQSFLNECTLLAGKGEREEEEVQDYRGRARVRLVGESWDGETARVGLVLLRKVGKLIL